MLITFHIVKYTYVKEPYLHRKQSFKYRNYYSDG